PRRAARLGSAAASVRLRAGTGRVTGAWGRAYRGLLDLRPVKLSLTLACGLYDRTFGLRDGSVPVEGVELNFLPMMPVETFRRQGRHAEFDACEFSLSTFMVLHARGDRRFVGIPVYPSRRFRHEHVW